MQKLLFVLVIASLVSPRIFLGEAARSANSPPLRITGGCMTESGPPSGRPEQKLLDQMIGSWDVDYAIYDDQGHVKHYLGTATYRWILERAAIQEVWTSNYRGRRTQPYGTTLEFFDAARKSWTAIWIYPEKGMYYPLSGGEAEGHIVLSGTDQEGLLQCWSNGDFRANSFVGSFNVSRDGGKTWRLVGINQMHRHATH
jgi:hypothetical protein